MSTAEMLRHLNVEGEYRFIEFTQVLAPYLRFFLRLPYHTIEPIFDDGRIAIRHIQPPLGLPLLLIACHLPSKLYRDAEDQYYRARDMRRRIADAETKVGHQNSIIIGDLNMNPFDPGMNAADGLHAVMDKTVANRVSRVVQGQTWDLFYNPMWSRLGDESSGPAGTYYHVSSSLISYFWNTFDQVLLRPSLLPYYDSRSLKVISKVRQENLADKEGRPSISDHFPLVISLNTEAAV